MQNNYLCYEKCHSATSSWQRCSEKNPKCCNLANHFNIALSYPWLKHDSDKLCKSGSSVRTRNPTVYWHMLIGQTTLARKGKSVQYTYMYLAARVTGCDQYHVRLNWMQHTTSVCHIYNDVIMSTTASQITSLTIFYLSLYSGADQRKHQSSVSLAFVRGIHRWPVNYPHKWQERGEWFHLITSSWRISKTCTQFCFALFCRGYIISTFDSCHWSTTFFVRLSQCQWSTSPQQNTTGHKRVGIYLDMLYYCQL